MRIGSLEVGPSYPCAIVAEIGNAHNQDFARALRLLDAAKAAGASAAKLQCYSVEELIALRGDGPAPEPWRRYTMRELYTRAMTPRDWFPKLYAHAADIALPLFSSVFGLDSLALLRSCGNPCLKISKFERNCRWLIDAVRTSDEPMLVSAPVDNIGFPDTIWYGDGLIYCPGGYPARLEEMRLRELEYSGWLGLSSHCKDPLVAPVAVGLGARYLEYHFMLEAEPSELESSVSLTETQFRDMVGAVRRTEEML